MIGDEEKNNLDNSNNNGTVLPRPTLPAAEIHSGNGGYEEGTV